MKSYSYLLALCAAGALLCGCAGNDEQDTSGHGTAGVEAKSPDLWKERFEQAKAEVPGFRVASVDEFRRINEWYDSTMLGEDPVHTFRLGRDRIHCIDIASQQALREVGLSGKPVPTQPSAPPRLTDSDPGATPATGGDDLGRTFGLDGLPDEEGRARRCPEGSFPKLVRSRESYFVFEHLMDIFRKLPPPAAPGVPPATTLVSPPTTSTLPTAVPARPVGGVEPIVMPFAANETLLAPPDAPFAPPGSSVGHEWAHAYRIVDNKGSQASFELWSPATEHPADFSLSQLWLTGGSGNGLQTVEVGWQVYPNLYGDSLSHLFIYSTQDNYNATGCYNTSCGIFVQTNPNIVLGGSFSSYSAMGGPSYYVTLRFLRDNGGTHDWWLRYGDDANFVWVGYYPNALFNAAGLANQASAIDFGGETYSSVDPTTSTTDMGSGQFPSSGFQSAAYIAGIKYVTTAFTIGSASNLVTSASLPASWKVGSVTYTADAFWGTYFFFGGPGFTGCQCASGACCDGCHYVPNGTVCRAAAGSCDTAESCTGASAQCPADAKKASGTVCRPSAGPCDAAEACNGALAQCPADAKVASGTVCRPSAGACDVAESCNGSTNSCPSDGFVGGGTVCRAAAGSCDTAESCTGASAQCPSDAKIASGTVCRPSAGTCDVAESCNGVASDCPPEGFVTAGTVCRGAAGPCDTPESCTGASAQCPSDVKLESGTVCRPSAGACDVAESCNGVASDCPPEGFVTAGTVCRGAAGPCDTPESCTGASAQCPSDAKVQSGTVCRSSVDVCDADESCDGSTDDCPPDAFLPAGTVCRAPTGSCDIAETCTGSFASCPADAALPDGDACDDGNACTVSDACQAGVCQGSSPCKAPDECHLAGTCDPTSGTCSNLEAPDGTPCSSGQCVSGVCSAPSDSGPGDSGSGDSGSGDSGSSNDPGGCGCHMAEPQSSKTYLWVLAGAFAIALRRRQRRR